MNLDDYISGYVDGDLTPEEDAELRALIAANPLAKEEFECAALISASFLHDAENISVPDDFFVETEAKLVAAFRETVKPTPVIDHKNVGKYRVAKYSAVLALLLVYFVSDVQIANQNSGLSLANFIATKKIQLGELKIESPLSHRHVAHSAITQSSSRIGSMTNNSISANEIAPKVENSQDQASSSIAIPQNGSEKNTTDVPVYTMNRNTPLPLSLPVSLQATLSTAPVAEQPNSISSPTTRNQSVIISSYISNGVYSSIAGANSTGVQGISHSIGFPVTTNDNIGLEVGVTSYSSITTQSFPTPSIASSGASSGGKKGGVLSENGLNTGGDKMRLNFRA